MTLDLASVGRTGSQVRTSWQVDDVLLYALAVGAGQRPGCELALTTDNTEGSAPKALPTFAAVLSQRADRPAAGRYDLSSVVHAEQHLTLQRPLPVSGEVALIAEIEAIYDKGSAALVWHRTLGRDVSTGEELFTARSSIIIRDEGGFGGNRGPTTRWRLPERQPDHVVAVAIRPEQALIYRLTGDRNPLHTDPAYAKRAGFARPILHGLCTFGVCGRTLVETLCDGDPDRLTAIGGRFTAPAYPGESLEVHVWEQGSRAAFRALNQGGRPVLDHGYAHLRA